MSIDDAIAFDYEQTCRHRDRAQAWCPLDDEGRRQWEAIVDAFEHHLTPTRLVGGPSDDGHRNYNFSATFGTPSELVDEPQLWVLVYVPAHPERTKPGIEQIEQIGRNRDYRWGYGHVAVTQRDGTVLTIRFWGGSPNRPAPAGTLDENALFARAVRTLKHTVTPAAPPR